MAWSFISWLTVVTGQTQSSASAKNSSGIISPCRSTFSCTWQVELPGMLGVKTDLQLPQLSPHCFWDHPNLRCQAAKLVPSFFYHEGLKQACSLVCTHSAHVHSRWQQKFSCRHKYVHTHTCCFASQSMKAGAMAGCMSGTCVWHMCQCQGCVAARWEPRRYL